MSERLTREDAEIFWLAITDATIEAAQQHKQEREQREAKAAADEQAAHDTESLKLAS